MIVRPTKRGSEKYFPKNSGEPVENVEFYRSFAAITVIENVRPVETASCFFCFFCRCSNRIRFIPSDRNCIRFPIGSRATRKTSSGRKLVATTAAARPVENVAFNIARTCVLCKLLSSPPPLPICRFRPSGFSFFIFHFLLVVLSAFFPDLPNRHGVCSASSTGVKHSTFIPSYGPGFSSVGSFSTRSVRSFPPLRLKKTPIKKKKNEIRA